jgi:hypothetical protein
MVHTFFSRNANIMTEKNYSEAETYRNSEHNAAYLACPEKRRLLKPFNW